MGELRRKAGVAKRRLLNARHELFPQQAEAGPAGQPGSFAVETTAATDALQARLSADDRQRLRGLIADLTETIPAPVPPGAPPQEITLASKYAQADPAGQRQLELHLGVHIGDAELLKKTGLLSAMPPADIHAMSHSPLASGGSFYHADLVASALASVAAPIAAGASVLDFGCSSGRVARALAAAFPELSVAGCDPNAPAIEWVQQHLPAIDARPSDNDPPLPWADASFDAAYAISIWSHFNEQTALDWYAEMHRVIKPGGHLITTTHGPHAVGVHGQLGLRSNAQMAEIRQALHERGYWYAAEFGADGDWGVVNKDWGTSFVSGEWMLAKLTPQWQIVEYARARNENNQDVYVLRRA